MNCCMAFSEQPCELKRYVTAAPPCCWYCEKFTNCIYHKCNNNPKVCGKYKEINGGSSDGYQSED